MLSHLVYVSVRNSECTDADIDAILASCQRNNAELDITGVLLYSETHFFQYLEGDRDQITRLYEAIKLDPRHRNVVMVTTGSIAERAFPSWQMAAKKYDVESVEFRTKLDPTEQEAFRALLRGEGKQSDRAIKLMNKLFH